MTNSALSILAQAKPPGLGPDPSQVTTAWMAGVVGMMLLFGVFALIGYVRRKKIDRTASKHT